LATGKPIVSTNIQACRMFKNVVKIAYSKEEFVSNIEDVLSENEFELTEKRKIIAKKNKWEDRIDQISQIIDSHIRKKLPKKIINEI
jgi:hypothetical protein